MNSKNVKLMAAAAVIIVVCLLFSWVQYGDEAPRESDDSFEGVWYPVYTYNSGMSAEMSAPEQLEATVVDGSVELTDGGIVMEYVLVSEHEAVSASAGATKQLYLEDGMLYLIYVYDDPDLNGMIYMAMSRDASATLPDDRIDITGFQAETGWGMVDGRGFQYPSDLATFSVESDSFHIARGTIVSSNFDVDFIGFVKSDAEETVVVGCYTDADGSAGLFNAVIIDGDVTAALMYRDTVVSFFTAELPTNLAPGKLIVDGSVVGQVDVENGMAYASYQGFVPGTFMWTLDEDFVCLEDGSLLSYDGGAYRPIIDLMVR